MTRCNLHVHKLTLAAVLRINSKRSGLSKMGSRGTSWEAIAITQGRDNGSLDT